MRSASDSPVRPKTRNKTMKATALALPVMSLAFAFAAPVSAKSPTGLSLEATGAAVVINQQNTCKDGEVWDETEKKCVKKEG